ncbi:DUF726-domain-containing protein [Lojkania enalia]|uniref:DUF726-domain-containing protein n=1 Tax=Lojkania enalia TaxID=147567 RepID=A0A9P4K4C8_9PLEO|nr:DUF726-domain-containing protein [Didymosphaeria enalia]
MSNKPSIPSWQRAQTMPPSASAQEQDSTTEKQPESSPAPAAEETSKEESRIESASLLEQASRFLEDPTIRDAPREKKADFLHSKGVASKDIDRLLDTNLEQEATVDVLEEGERAWPKLKQEASDERAHANTVKASSKPSPAQSQSQAREIPPIVTYPEFLTQSTKPPPLITTQRLLTTAYVTGGLVATMYGLSKYILSPMTQTLTEARHDFASHAQEQLSDFNKRLENVVSADPAEKRKSRALDTADDISEADSDPTELFHRDMGTQTTPSLSRRPSVVVANKEDKSVTTAHENRLKVLTSHLRELEATRSNDSASTNSLRTKLSDLSSYLGEMSYQNQYYNGMGGMYGGNYGLPRAIDGKEDQIEVLKADIRAVKGVFLSARNFPAGGRSAPRVGIDTQPKFYILNSMAANLASKLPFGRSKSPSPSKSSDETSLTTLLTQDQCADLTFLIASITATMRKSLLDTFTAEESPPLPRNKSEEALRAAPTDLSEVDVEKEDKLRKDLKQREKDARKELANPEVQELKKGMLNYFDEWRGRIIVRVGEVVNSREEAKKQSLRVEDKKIEQIFNKQDTELRSISDIEDEGEDEDKVFKELYPAERTTLTQLEEDKRALVLHSLVLIVLSLEHYSAHSRILLLHLASSLNFRLSVLKKDEEAVARGLLEAADQQLNADAETKKKAEASSTSRKWKVGLASVAGAALIGVTGGLAAPLLAAGVGTVMGGLGLGATAAAGYLGTLAGSSVLVGSLFGAYGARMTGKAMDDYAREVSDFGFVPIHNFHRPRKLEKEFRRLRVGIAVSGWLTSKEEVVIPWRYINPTIEGFALRWELETLLRLGNGIDSFVKSAAWSYAKGQIIKRTVFGALSAGLWPLGLLKVSSILDNPFSVAKYRADKAGEVLADALINKVQGERPVTLIGYSLGARLIYACLQSLADRKAFGLVESVVLLGSPIPSDAADWRRIRSIVSGRVVNVFSTNDYILAFLYRTSSVQYGVAGLQPILGVHGVQNVDVSEIVDGHLRYRYLTGSILKKIGFEDIDVKEVEQEEGEMKAVEEMESKAREKKAKRGKNEDDEADELKKEVAKKTADSMMDWTMAKMNIGSIWGGENGYGTSGNGGGSGGEKSQAEKK